ncbi:MAG: hypothetical protein JEZ03_15770 [Bacteroidales bacterium]|nr:hypothetical protein [Bacteroidales bacterium]
MEASQSTLSYPSFVFLDENHNLITIVKGFQNAEDFVVILEYIGSGDYLKTTWEEYNQK